METLREPLRTLDLVGDGDEVAAIQAVEEELGIALDYKDAAGWVTAGDVFRSCLRALPRDAEEDAEIWSRFTRAIAGENGSDPSRVTPETRLLGPGIP